MATPRTRAASGRRLGQRLSRGPTAPSVRDQRHQWRDRRVVAGRADGSVDLHRRRIEGSPGSEDSWAWKNAGGLPDKDNLAARLRGPLLAGPECRRPVRPAGHCRPTCEVIFFGSDRFANDGDAVQGFWFFQNKIELTNTPSAAVSSSAVNHQNGDLLMISDFSNGGAVSTIYVHKWDTDLPEGRQQQPTAQPVLGGEPAAARQLDAANCATSAATAGFCGIVNTGDATSPRRGRSSTRPAAPASAPVSSSKAAST